MIASFQEPAEGLEHHDPMPQGVPDPETLPTTADLLGKINHPVAREWAFERPFDIRHVTEPIYFGPTSERTAESAVWLRTTGRCPMTRHCTAPPWPTSATTHCSNLCCAATGSAGPGRT